MGSDSRKTLREQLAGLKGNVAISVKERQNRKPPVAKKDLKALADHPVKAKTLLAERKKAIICPRCGLVLKNESDMRIDLENGRLSGRSENATWEFLRNIEVRRHIILVHPGQKINPIRRYIQKPRSKQVEKDIYNGRSGVSSIYENFGMVSSPPLGTWKKKR